MRKTILFVLVGFFFFGIVGMASAANVTVTSGNGKIEVFVGGPILISAPYQPGDKGGTRPMKAGENVVMSAGNLGQATGIAKNGGLLFSFPAPEKDVDVVFNAALNGNRGAESQWLCLPWGNPFVFQKGNPNHPNGVVIVGAFGIRGGKVVHLTESMGSKGYTLTQGGGGVTSLGDQLKE